MTTRSPGVPVIDEVYGNWLVLTSDPYGSANTVTANGKPISEYTSNEDYPGMEPVVDAVYPNDLSQLSDREKPVVYTFPQNRLKTFRFRMPTRQRSIPKGEGQPRCYCCGVSIKPKDPYIEGSDGRTYCDINCMNEALIA